MRGVKLIALGFAAALSACSVRIDEAAVFRPQSGMAPAETVEQLARWPVAELRASAPEAQATHGFLGAGDDRIAYTLVSLPGAARPLIVYCGGNSGDRFNSGVYYALKALPYGDVVLLDYPGYGDSPGGPSAARLAAIAPAVSALAVGLAGDRPLVLWGQSLGGFICSEIAQATAQADAIILEATARRAIDVARAWRPWYLAPFVRISIADSLQSYDNAARLDDFAGPILVLGARRDDTLPVRLSRELAVALRERERRVSYVEFPRAGHLDISRQPEFAAVAQTFFASLQVDHD
jgi:pimeloyl-ACP methyl ester carboxylesterase